MSVFLEQFHWLRPEWLLGIIPAIIISLLLWLRKKQSSSWQTIIAPELLHHLIDGQPSSSKRRLYAGLFCCWTLACLALAGPSWEKLPQPVHKTESALIILLDLSPSMLAEDVRPSRLVRARHKLTDLLQTRKEGLSALIAYAGEAHVVTPLTDDNATIESLLPALSPGVMPLQGSNTEMAVEKALALFKDAGIAQGEILLATDGITEQAIDTLKDLLKNTRFHLSILGVGTDDGAPIPTARGGFAKDRQGGIIIASLNSAQLNDLARQLKGRYSNLRPDDQDIQWLTEAQPLSTEQTRQLEREFDTWQEYGHWAALLLLPALLLCFRRGLILSSICIPLLLMPNESYAFSWSDLWLTDDQQGQRQLEAGDAQQAANTFASPDWKGAAQYRAGDFEAAAGSFKKGTRAQDHYNRGNALAHGGNLEEALEAYQQALEQNPDFEDAQYNQKLVEELLKQQQQQQQQQNSDQNQNQDQQNQDQQDQGQQSQNQDQQNQGESQNTSQEQQGQQAQEEQNQQSQQQDAQQQKQESSSNREQDKQSPQDREQAQQQSASQQTQPDEKSDQTSEEQSIESAQESDLSPEEQQAMEQWLRQIPDDPSGLLRKKFQHQYRQRRKEYQSGNWKPPENNANERW